MQNVEMIFTWYEYFFKTVKQNQMADFFIPAPSFSIVIPNIFMQVAKPHTSVFR
jgi:hypothetical protein